MPIENPCISGTAGCNPVLVGVVNIVAEPSPLEATATINSELIAQTPPALVPLLEPGSATDAGTANADVSPELGGPVNFKGLNFGLSAGLIGGTVGIKWDSHSNVYLSGGPSFGLSLPINGSFVIDGRTYNENGAQVFDERSVRNIITGPSSGVNLSSGFPYMNGSWNTPNPYGIPIGFFGVPIPTGASTMAGGVGTPEASYSPQLTRRILKF
jgi:hypothetical protein